MTTADPLAPLRAKFLVRVADDLTALRAPETSMKDRHYIVHRLAAFLISVYVHRLTIFVLFLSFFLLGAVGLLCHGATRARSIVGREARLPLSILGRHGLVFIRDIKHFIVFVHHRCLPACRGGGAWSNPDCRAGRTRRSSFGSFPGAS